MEDELTEVEKRFAEGMLEALPARGKPWTLEPENREYVRERMKFTAYHEAGHFVARAFTRLELSHVVTISIIPRGEILGRVTYERPFALYCLEHYPPEIQRANGIFLLLHELAGYRVEMILKRTEGETVFDHIEEEGCFDFDDEDESCDFGRARHIAGILSRPFMPPYRILTLADRWTAEMLKIPPVWKGVEKVAGLLIARGEITDREEIYQLSSSLNIPFIYDLPKWRRRLMGSFPKKNYPPLDPEVTRQLKEDPEKGE